MFVSSICCITGSFFHVDNRNTDAKLRKSVFVFTGIYVAESLTAIGVTIVAILGLFSIQGLTVNLSYTTKIVMTVGGTLLIIGDTYYLIYRLNRSSAELNKNNKKEDNENRGKIERAHTKITEKIAKLKQVEPFYASLLQEDQKKIENEKKWVQDQEGIDGEIDLSEEKKRIEKDFLSHQETFNALQSKIQELQENQETLARYL